MVAISPPHLSGTAERVHTSRQPTFAPPRSTVLGVRLHHLTEENITPVLRACVRAGKPHQFATVNLDFLRIAQRDSSFARVLDDADFAIADGMPVVWLSRLAGQPVPERLAGVDLVLAAAALAAEDGYSLFLMGAAPGVASDAASRLAVQHPGLQIAGTYSPPVGEWPVGENDRIIERIRAARPQFLFVALGAPRQDVWIHQHLNEIGVPVCVGVGGTFDILSGRIKRAPHWMQYAGLEWAYRLQAEPRRLWRRYLLRDLPFLARTVSAHTMSMLGVG